VGLVLFVSEVRVIGVRVLGPLQVIVDGVPADVGGPRQRCVLARLIAEHGRVVSADRLIEDLYGDEAPPRALAAVQSYVSHLRRALEPGRPARAPSGILVTSPPGYAIQLGQDAVDAWSFEDEIHQAAELDDPAAVQNRLSSALASWRGTAFQEFGGMPWADLEASRLEELRLMAIERLANAALRLGRAAQTVAGLDRLTAEHPLREEAWRLLALALYQSGRQGDALSALRRARARLAADLGVDPGPALRELESDILAQAPRLSAPPAALSHTSVAAVPTSAGNDAAPAAAAPYVGREAELSQVIAAGALIQATCARPADEQTERAITERTGVPGTPGAGRRGDSRGRHAQTRKPEPGWVPTAERFRDPSSGVIMRVWIDPSDESRHYVPDDAPTPL
jgi:DNA-binding SARP family transcriptional activator